MPKPFRVLVYPKLAFDHLLFYLLSLVHSLMLAYVCWPYQPFNRLLAQSLLPNYNL
jgi:hypothetical protein